MKTIFISAFALLSFSVSASEQCVYKRYALNGSDLQAGDYIELKLNSIYVELSITEANKHASVWPRELGDKLNSEIHANIASIGDYNTIISLKRYLTSETVSGNILDLYLDNYIATLEVNGAELQGALSETYAAFEGFTREINLPQWVATSGDNAWIYVTNISDKETTVFLEFSDQAGNTLTSGVTGHEFTSGNPLDINGAVLAPNKSAYLHIAATNPFKFGTGRLKWTTSSCEPVELMVSMNQTTSRSTQIFRLNGGNPIK